MKKFIALVSVILIPAFGFGQKSLPDSKRHSEITHVYSLDAKQVHALFVKDAPVDEKFLTTKVAEYPYGGAVPELPRGNYLLVSANNDELVYDSHTVDDLQYSVTQDDGFVFDIRDAAGSPIGDARVRVNGGRVRYDRATRTYRGRLYGNEERLAEIENKGVYHYVTLDRQSRRGWGGSWLDRIAQCFGGDSNPRDRYTGFVVFSKPRYKPGEKIELKAWVTDQQGRPVNKPLDLRLVMGSDIDTLLKRVEPYRPGAYAYDFTPGDSLRMKLDRHYNIVLSKPGNRRQEYLRGSFRYEDYELKAIKFSATAPKTDYQSGDTVKVMLNAADENGMAVFDGQVTVTIEPQLWNVRMHTGQVFVPERAWEHTVPLTDASRKELIIPDSVFVPGVSLTYRVSCVYLDAANERHAQNLSLNYNNSGYAMQFTPTARGLEIARLHNGKSAAAMVQLTAIDNLGKEIRRDSISLPATIAPSPFAARYKVTGKGIDEEYSMYSYSPLPVSAAFTRDGDDIRLKVANPLGYGFRYSIGRNGSEIETGYATELDYRRRGRTKDTYTATVWYVFGGQTRKHSYTIEPTDKRLTVEVQTPASVYPGRKTEVGLAVSDSKGHPVAGADVTAYAYTSKFGATAQRAPFYGKVRSGRVDYDYYGSSPNTIAGDRSTMTWERWRTDMGLDRIEYYRFLNPEPVYVSSVDTPDGTTQIAPYVSIDGSLQGVQVLSINGVPRYVKHAGQMDVYSFEVDHTSTLTIRMRTWDREVTVHKVQPIEGKKLILSIDGATHPEAKIGNGIAVEIKDLSGSKGKNKGVLSAAEADNLQNYMVSIDRTFDYKQPTSNRYSKLEDPYFIESGGTLYYLNPQTTTRYRQQRGNSILVGPIFYRMPPARLFRFDRSVNGFVPEGGMNYTLFENYQKVTKWGHNPMKQRMSNYKPSPDFRQTALRHEDIEAEYMNRLADFLSNIGGSLYSSARRENSKNYRLRMQYDGKSDGAQTITRAGNGTGAGAGNGNGADADAGGNLQPIMVIFDNRPDTLVYAYSADYMGEVQLPESEWDMTLVFGDFSHHSQRISLRDGGTNLVNLKDIAPVRDSLTSRRIMELIDTRILKHIELMRPPTIPPGMKYKPWPWFVSKADDPTLAPNEIAGVVTDATGSPIAGAIVRVENSHNATIADQNGMFRLRGNYEGKKITISAIGMETLWDTFNGGKYYRIIMTDMANAIEEVSVTGFGSRKNSQKRDNASESQLSYDTSFNKSTRQSEMADNLLNTIGAMSPSMRITETGAGKDSNATAEIHLYGSSSRPQTEVDGNPLIIIDGVERTKEELERLAPATILSMSILKEESATALYGSRAANGVIIVTTAGGNAGIGMDGEADGGMSLRRNFHDDAFWQPRLTTDAEGKASFEVTYPDDITNWSANFLAVTSKRQSGQAALSIASYKALSARLSLPRFAIEGDHMTAIGRLSNYQGDTVQVRQDITIDGREEERTATLAQSQVDTIAVSVGQQDSVRLRYTLTARNGYFDGEERTIPVYRRGVLETYGKFEVVGDPKQRTYRFDPARGKVTVHAEASSFELFMREIAKVDEYPYLCNEQMASKLVALLEKKALCKAFGVEFKEERKITQFIGKLTANANGDGLWGWWNQDGTVKWISGHVLRALLQAEKAGYAVNLNKTGIASTLIGQVSTSSGRYYVPEVRREMIDNMLLLTDLGAEMPYAVFISQIDTVQANTQADRLDLMRLKARHGIGFELDSLMKHSQRTMMGGLYWGQTRMGGIQPRTFILPTDNSVEYTLAAYEILKSLGGHEDELTAIRNWFFEQRKGSGWANTYQSARILSTIIPDMVKPGDRPGEVNAQINGQTITKFPYTGEFDASEITLTKTGTAPLFFTAYQREWNPEPERASEGFTVTSAFRENRDTVAVLTAGTTVWLDVKVTADSDAEYVMIEVPIPAGCSYESKGQRFWREVHREHYKDRVSIFCNQLPKGESHFTIELIPRFTGEYHLNPARAELMYFPTFYGREEMKRIGIVRKE